MEGPIFAPIFSIFEPIPGMLVNVGRRPFLLTDNSVLYRKFKQAGYHSKFSADEDIYRNVYLIRGALYIYR